MVFLYHWISATDAIEPVQVEAAATDCIFVITIWSAFEARPSIPWSSHPPRVVGPGKPIETYRNLSKPWPPWGVPSPHIYYPILSFVWFNFWEFGQGLSHDTKINFPKGPLIKWDMLVNANNDCYIQYSDHCTQTLTTVSQILTVAMRYISIT